VKVDRPLDEDDNDDAAKAANDLDSLTVAQDGKTTTSRIRFDLDLPAEADDDVVLADGILLPEWDWRKQVLQPAHSRLQMMVARDAQACELPVSLRSTAKRLRNQFQSLTPQRERLRAQANGSDLDMDACVRYAAERASGQPVGEPGLYIDNRNRSRDLSCLLLADLSLSTDAWVSNSARVIDVIRDSLLLFGEALSATGDRFALYGFSSVRRQNVRYHLLKGFDERYGSTIRGRLAAIKPGFYTRMGAAIRHSANILSKQKSARRLLLILTDGKPNDLDKYEGRYGIEDTRVAIHEARRLGLTPFCVTIDEKAGDYLPHLFGANGYAVVRNAEMLPQVLPRLYVQLTGNP
jgi:nitric oxide reductase NorD protein